MKITYKNIYAFSIYLVFFLNLGFLNLFGAFDRKSFLFSIIISIVTFFIYLSQPNKKNVHYPMINIYVVLAIVIFFIQLIRIRALNFTRMSLGSAFITFGGVLLLLLIFPLYELNISENTKFLKNIVFLGCSALGLRTILWLLFNFASINLAPAFFAGKETWGRLIFGKYLTRLTGTFLDGFMFVYFVINFFKTKSSNKFLFFIGILYLFIYSMIIYQSRFQMLTYIIVFTIMAFILTNSVKNKFFIISFLVLLIMFCFSFLTNFFSTFSVNSVEYGGSTQARLDGIQYLFNEWKEISTWLGFGFRYDDETKYRWTVFYLSDYGILANLFQLGIIGFVVYLIPFFSGIITSFRSRQNTLLMAFTIFLCIYSCSINPYLMQQITILPLFVGFILCGKSKERKLGING
ncbi:hypothetical protein [Lactobacillus isalae]|uniref:hypothetical protein n=1 Tax=Lactobacillus isalae TaxID=2993455 RepID=UPI0024A9A3F2|nr:hypothetical protein [Lactobacillus isalae]